MLLGVAVIDKITEILQLFCYQPKTTVDVLSVTT